MSDDDGEIWIGIADAVPVDPEAAEIGGAFVHVLAPAADWLEFRIAAELALAEQGFRVADLDEAELVRDRLRTGADLPRDLLELALDAAFQRETRLGVFHTYPPEDAPDPEAYEARALGTVRDELRIAQASRALVTVASRYSWHETVGHVADTGAEWALFQLVDGNGLADGFRALKLERISEIAPVDPEESFLPRLLAERPLASRRPRADLSATRALLADVQHLPGLVSITTEDMHAGSFRIGGISALREDGVLLQTVSRVGAWSDEELYAYDAIIEIGFGGPYAEALALAAGPSD